MAVKEGSAIAADVKHKEGIPVPKASLQSHAGLIAVYQRQAQHYGCGDQQLKIASRKHVLAVPKGENGLLVALEEHLDASGY